MFQIKFYFTLEYQIEVDTIQMTYVDIHGIMKVNMKDSNEIRCHNEKLLHSYSLNNVNSLHK